MCDKLKMTRTFAPQRARGTKIHTKTRTGGRLQVPLFFFFFPSSLGSRRVPAGIPAVRGRDLGRFRTEVCFPSACLICLLSNLRWKVTIDLELHVTGRTNSKSSGRPRGCYHVYIYRLPKQAEPRAPSRSRAPRGPGRTWGHSLRWEGWARPPSSPSSGAWSPPPPRDLRSPRLNV